MLISPKAKVSIIILNWNGVNDTLECLKSLYKVNYNNFDIIVVDNASEDDSVEQINKYHKEKNNQIITRKKSHSPVKNYNSNKNLFLIENDKNYGFAEGNNIGIKYALNNLKPDYILLLNNDTIVDKEFLSELINVGDSEDKIGILGPTIYWHNEKNKIQSAGVKLHLNLGMQKVIGLNEIDVGQFKEVSSVDYVSGCALLAKSEIFSEIGYLDRDYFLYWEELDFCFRSRENYLIVHVPPAKIWHKGSVSSTDSTKVYYMIRNCFWFMEKNTSKFHYITFLFFFFTTLFWYRSFILIFYYKDLRSLRCYYKGIKRGLK